MAQRHPVHDSKEWAAVFAHHLSYFSLCAVATFDEWAGQLGHLSPFSVTHSNRAVKPRDSDQRLFVTVARTRSRHTGWECNYPDRSRCCEMSTAHDRIPDRVTHLDRVDPAWGATHFYCHRFWQMLFVFKCHHEAQGFSEQWLIMYSAAIARARRA